MSGGRPVRVFLGAFGQPGHTFPMLALGAELAARGHEVTYETWSRWRELVEANGMTFVAAPEGELSAPGFGDGPYRTVVKAAAQTRRAVAAAEPDVVVHDILTLAPALAGELEDVSVATLVPHVHPEGQRGFPPYAFGARMPRTPIGRRWWRIFEAPVAKGLHQGRDDYNAVRARLGLSPVPYVHSGLSRTLTMVATLPQLEYPRPWPSWAHVVGPLFWEPPYEFVEPPPGEDPLVLVAPSTAQDPEHLLLRAALEGLAGEPVRVLATWNRRPLPGPARVAANTRLVEWVSYAKTMPHCALVICHAGHGTLVRALACGCRVVAVPHVGDMAENASRLDWAGAGVRLPWPLLHARTLRLATRRALADPRLGARAAEMAAWAERNPGAARAADLVEQMARRRAVGANGEGLREQQADASGESAGASLRQPPAPAERDSPAPTR